MKRLIRTAMMIVLPLCLTGAAIDVAVRAADPQTGPAGVVHESKPTEDRKIADVRVHVRSGESVGTPVMTDAEGRFTLASPVSAGVVLELTKEGYEPARVTIRETTGTITVAMTPTLRTLQITRSGKNDCTELPAPPGGVPGGREYARFPAHHDGTVTVMAAQLPFASNPGFLYRQTPAGWVKNEFDYVLLRQPLPVLGGFWYVLTFGEGMDNCGPWSLDATHPS
jgi:hypothetical protein